MEEKDTTIVADFGTGHKERIVREGRECVTMRVVSSEDWRDLLTGDILDRSIWLPVTLENKEHEEEVKECIIECGEVYIVRD